MLYRSKFKPYLYLNIYKTNSYLYYFSSVLLFVSCVSFYRVLVYSAIVLISLFLYLFRQYNYVVHFSHNGLVDFRFCYCSGIYYSILCYWDNRLSYLLLLFVHWPTLLSIFYINALLNNFAVLLSVKVDYDFCWDSLIICQICSTSPLKANIRAVAFSEWVHLLPQLLCFVCGVLSKTACY